MLCKNHDKTNTLLRLDLSYSDSENNFKYKANKTLTWERMRKFQAKIKKMVKRVI